MDRVTVRDVARLAGVSIATVSRVINKTNYVSPEIERKVYDAIEAVGYVPNSVARSLKMTSTFSVGFIVSDISNKYFMTIAKAIEDRISERNFNLIVASTEGRGDRELAYLNMLVGKKVDGLILNSSGENEKYIAKLSENIPTVLLHRKLSEKGFIGDIVDSNNVNGGYALAKELLKNGHQRIGIVSGPLRLSTGKERLEGMMRAFKEFKISFNEDFLFEGDFTHDSGYQGAKYLIGRSEPPSAVILANNQMAIGALLFIKESKFRIPEDISVVAYGNIDHKELLFVDLTIVNQDPWILGNRAGQLILDRIENKSVYNQEVIFESMIVPGNSIASIEKN
jgi:LacI family transcriptional regulator